ncbi:hypothetical protein H8E88_07855 [candidate division KSB1 bacterium]|nr:hypothetical protein [candidate division KSB1 bacterium]
MLNNKQNIKSKFLNKPDIDYETLIKFLKSNVPNLSKKATEQSSKNILSKNIWTNYSSFLSQDTRFARGNIFKKAKEFLIRINNNILKEKLSKLKRDQFHFFYSQIFNKQNSDKIIKENVNPFFFKKLYNNANQTNSFQSAEDQFTSKLNRQKHILKNQQSTIEPEFIHPKKKILQNLTEAGSITTKSLSSNQFKKPVGIAELPREYNFPNPDVNEVAKQVYTIIESNLRVERERRGIF